LVIVFSTLEVFLFVEVEIGGAMGVGVALFFEHLA